MRERILVALAVEASELTQRLSPLWAELIGLEITVDDRCRFKAQPLTQHGNLVECIPNLFHPATHVYPALISVQALFQLVGVTVALCKIKYVAGIIGFILQGLFEDPGIICVFLDGICASPPIVVTYYLGAWEKL